MRRARWTMAAAAIVLVGATQAAADPITIIRDGRTTNTLADPFRGGHAETAPPSDTMRSVATVAVGTRSGASTGTLSSSYADPLRWFGAGAADVSFTTPDPANYFADSRSQSVSESTRRSTTTTNFNGFATSSSLVSPTSEGVSAEAFSDLTGAGGLIFGFFGSESGNRTFTGLLSPGMYTLFVAASARGISDRGPVTGAANAGFAFTIDFTPSGAPAPTPEPASLLLLGTGIAGVFGFHRRLKRTATPPESKTLCASPRSQTLVDLASFALPRQRRSLLVVAK
jgi:PEP-CTERM motif-containing protein